MGKDDSGKKFAIGALLGAVGGFLAGILTAPKSGKETRTEIKNTVDSTASEAEKSLKKLHTELSRQITNLNSKTEDLRGKASEKHEEMLDQAERLKRKSREVLTALHEGDTSDKDLEKIISETKTAISDIKKYLSK